MGVWKVTHENRYIRKIKKKRKEKESEEHRSSLNCQPLAWKSHAVTTMPLLLFFRIFFFFFFFGMENLKYF